MKIFVNEIYDNKWLKIEEEKEVTEIYLMFKNKVITGLNAKTDTEQIIGRDFNLYTFVLKYHSEITRGLDEHIKQLEYKIIFSKNVVFRNFCNTNVCFCKNCKQEIKEMLNQ